MKSFFLASFLTVSAFLSAQQTATNINTYDCQGNHHDLFTELDTGCVVVIDWVMPCATCVGPSLTAYNIVQSYAASYPGRVKFYVVDDYNNTTCPALTNWTVSNNMPGTTTFADSSIRMGDYGTAGMPKIIVLGGLAHYVYYNMNGAGNATLLQSAISTALGETTVPEHNATSNTLIAWANKDGNNITLSFSADQRGIALIDIYSVDGKVVRLEEQHAVVAGENKIEIGTAELSTAMYLVTVTIGDRILRTKLFVE